MYALAATAPIAPTAPSAAAQAALAALRAQPCWSQELHNCVETDQPSSLPVCATIRAGYQNPADKPALDAAVDAVPFCPAPSTNWMLIAGAAAIGLGAGLLLGSLRSG